MKKTADPDLLTAILPPRCEKPPMAWLDKWNPVEGDTAEIRRKKWIIREQFVFCTPCPAQKDGSLWDCLSCAAWFRRSVETPPPGAWAA